MIQALPAILAAIAALDVAAALAAHLRGRRPAAHLLNGVALGVFCAGSLLAFLAGGAANAHAGPMAAFAGPAGLAALCFWNARRRLLPVFVFWLAWGANLAILALLLYLLFWFRIF